MMHSGTPQGWQDRNEGCKAMDSGDQSAIERTWMAWVRSGLAAVGLAFLVGRLVPALVAVSHVEFGLLGVGYGLLGVLLLVLAAYRERKVRKAFRTDATPPIDQWTVWVVFGVATVLGLLTILVVLAVV